MKKRAIFITLAFLMVSSFAFISCGDVEIRYKEVEVPVDPRPQFRFELDSNEFTFVAPVTQAFNTPGPITVNVTNTGSSSLPAGNVTVINNWWLMEPRDFERYGDFYVGTDHLKGSLIIGGANLPPLASNATTSFTLDIAEFGGERYSFSRYIEPAHFIVEVTFGTAEPQRFNYTVGTYQAFTNTSLNLDFQGAPRVNAITNVAIPGLQSDWRLSVSDPSVARIIGDNQVQFLKQGEVQIGFVSGHGFLEDHENNPYAPAGAGFAAQPFEFRGERLLVEAEEPVFIEKVVSNNSIQFDVHFNVPVRRPDPSKFVVLANIEATNQRVLHGGMSGNIIPMMAQWSPLQAMYGGVISGGILSDIQGFRHHNGAVVFPVDTRSSRAPTMQDEKGKVWRFVIDSNTDRPVDQGYFTMNDLGGYSLIQGHIGRLVAVQPGAAVHAVYGNPMPAINEIIIDNNVIPRQVHGDAFPENRANAHKVLWGNRGVNVGNIAFFPPASSDIFEFGNGGTITVPDPQGEEGATITIPNSINNLIEHGIGNFKKGPQYQLRNVFEFILTQYSVTNNPGGNTDGRRKNWWVVLDEDQIIDYNFRTQTLPEHMLSINFQNSNLVITVADERTAADPVTVRFDGNFGFSAVAGLTIQVDGKGNSATGSALIFDAAPWKGAIDGKEYDLPGHNGIHWISAGRGGRMILNGGVVFRNHHVTSDSSFASAGLRVGGEGGATLIVRDALIENNSLTRTSQASTDHLDQGAAGAGITVGTLPIATGGGYVQSDVGNGVLLMMGGIIRNNKVLNAGGLPAAGGVMVGRPHTATSSRLYLTFNNWFFMTGGEISGNSAALGATAGAGGVFVSGVFQKTGGEIKGNTATGGGHLVANNAAALLSTGTVMAGVGTPAFIPNPFTHQGVRHNADVSATTNLFTQWNGVAPIGRDPMPLTVPAWWGRASNWD